MDLFGVFYIPNFLLVTFVFLLSFYLNLSNHRLPWPIAPPPAYSTFKLLPETELFEKQKQNRYGRRTFGFFSQYGIKYPKPTTFFGNLMEVGQKGFTHIFFDWKKKYGDCYGIFFGSVPNLVITDPEIIGEIMVKSFSNFTNRPITFSVDEYSSNMLIVAKDDHWKYLRTVLAPSYSSKKMREMVPLVENVLKTFEKNLNKIADSKEATDVTILFSGYTMDVIVSTGFGINVDSQEDPDSPVVKNAREIFAGNFFKSLQGLAIIFPTIAKILNNFKPVSAFGNMSYFIDFCKELVEERKKEKNTGRKDLLQLMLDAQLEGHENMDKETEQGLKLENITDWRLKRGLTDSEVIAQCMIFLVAGFETTASTFSFFSYSMAMNPNVQDKICQEIEEKLGQESPNYDNVQKLTYLDMCLKETLRLYPIGLALSRESKEDCTIKGIKIPKNTGVFFPVMCLHYDSRYWNEPEKFNPENFNKENKAKQTPFTYLPFGGGPRICAGIRLAELEFKMAVVQMLMKFRLVPCEKTENKIEFAKAGVLKAKNGIWIKIEHR